MHFGEQIRPSTRDIFAPSLPSHCASSRVLWVQKERAQNVKTLLVGGHHPTEWRFPELATQTAEPCLYPAYAVFSLALGRLNVLFLPTSNLIKLEMNDLGIYFPLKNRVFGQSFKEK